MLIKKNSKITSKVVLLSLVAVVLMGAGVFAYFNNISDPVQDPSADAKSAAEREKRVNVVNNDAPTDAEKAAGDAVKQQSTNEAPESTLSVTISAANQNGTLLQVRAFANIVSDSASCEITLSKGSKKIVKSALTQAGPNISSCRGFDINLSELEAGTWALRVTITEGTQSGSAQQQVVIEG